MRLIDATNAIESIDEIVCSMSVCINSDYYNGMRKMKDMALHAIEKQPTVNADPVVRCGECAYRRRCMLQHFVESNAVDGAKIDWSEWYCADGVLDISKSDGESEDDAD